MMMMMMMMMVMFDRLSSKRQLWIPISQAKVCHRRPGGASGTNRSSGLNDAAPAHAQFQVEEARLTTCRLSSAPTPSSSSFRSLRALGVSGGGASSASSRLWSLTPPAGVTVEHAQPSLAASQASGPFTPPLARPRRHRGRRVTRHERPVTDGGRWGRGKGGRLNGGKPLCRRTRRTDFD